MSADLWARAVMSMTYSSIRKTIQLFNHQAQMLLLAQASSALQQIWVFRRFSLTVTHNTNIFLASLVLAVNVT